MDAIAKHLGDANSRREEKVALLQAAAAIGPPAKDAIPAIAKLLGERETAVRVAAAETLGKVGTGNTDAIKSLAAPLADIKNTPLAVQAAVLKALAGMGPAAKAAAPEVKAFGEKVNDPGTRVWAAATLVALGADADANSKVVLAALKDKAANAKTARGTAVEAAEFLGPRGSPAVPDLIEVLQDKAQPGTTREKAARALGKLGAREAIRPLTDALRDPDKALRRAAAEGLGLMGPDAVIAAPKLRDLVKSDPSSADAAQAAPGEDRAGEEGVSRVERNRPARTKNRLLRLAFVTNPTHRRRQVLRAPCSWPHGPHRGSPPAGRAAAC